MKRSLQVLLSFSLLVGSLVAATRPAQAVLPNYTDVSVGDLFTCAVTSVGGVQCWGANVSGTLGDGTFSGGVCIRDEEPEVCKPFPVDVVGIANAEAVTATGYGAVSGSNGHACALLSGGGLRCWGANRVDELGGVVTTLDPYGQSASHTPIAVTGFETSGALQVSAGASHTCAVTTTYELSCWGWDVGDQTIQPTPQTVSGLPAVQQVATGSQHDCALTTGGDVWCWGSNQSGQLGTPSVGSASPIPVDIGLSGVSSIAASEDHTCAAMLVGGVKCWGSNQAGALGTNTTREDLPADVPGFTAGIESISTGMEMTCAVTASGDPYCWGTIQRTVAFPPGNDKPPNQTPGAALVPGFTGTVDDLAVGQEHLCAVVAAGAVECLGFNSQGGMGTGSLKPELSDSTQVPFALLSYPDTTPPRIGNPEVYGLTNDYGWFTGPVDIFWEVSDTGGDAGSPFGGRGSGVVPPTGGPSTYLRGILGITGYALEGVHTVSSGPVCDSAGNCTSSDVTVRIDGGGGPDEVSESVATGGSVTTDGSGDGATAQDPVETSVTTPSGGPVSIAEAVGPGMPYGFEGVGPSFEIHAPIESVAQPLVLVFTLDASLIPLGVDETNIKMLKNTISVPACTGSPGEAAPNPCISLRERVDGDIRLTVLTVDASFWTFAVATGPTDTNPPTVTGVPDRAANANGWYKAPVTIDWQAVDDSGQATDPPDTIAQTEGANVTYESAESCDPSHNCAPGSLNLSIDKTVPVLAPTVSPTEVLLMGPVSVTPHGTDALSGIDTQSCGAGSTSTVGPKSVSCSATDKAGNTVTSPGSYAVHYRWDGFLQPINDLAYNPSLRESRFRLGSSVLVMFSLKRSNGTSVQAGTAPTFSTSGNLGACDAITTLEVLNVLPATSGTSFRWLALTSSYFFNWRTTGRTAGEYRITATLEDGTQRSVDVCLRV